MKILSEYALAYAKLGWSIFPIKTKEKKPKIKWEKYQREKATEEQIKNWWKKWPDANIGIVTGAISGIIAIDIDSMQGREAYINQFGELHGTISQRTGKPEALQLIFKHPKDQDYSNRARMLPDVDVRGDGGYIVAAPSIHPNGVQYQWDIDPTEMGLDDLMDLPDDVKVELNNSQTIDGTNKNAEGWVQEALMGGY